MIALANESITMIPEPILTCPHCKNEQQEELLENISPVNYRCENCQQRVKINKGECCIYCEFGDYPCLHEQFIGSACCGPD